MQSRPSLPAVPSAGKLAAELFGIWRGAADLARFVLRKTGSSNDRVDQTGSAEWTNALLNTVLKAGETRGFEVYPRQYYFSRKGAPRNSHYDPGSQAATSRKDRGEWMLDACWTRYPPYDNWLRSLETCGEISESGIALACECEWGAGPHGRQQTPKPHTLAVIDDFAKLVDVHAQLKVMFFGFLDVPAFSTGSFEYIRSLLEKLARADRDGAEYLAIAWPFWADWSHRLTTARVAIGIGGSEATIGEVSTAALERGAGVA